MHIQSFSFRGHLEDTFPGGWSAGRPAGWLAGRPNLKIMLTSAQLGLAGAWAELGNIFSGCLIGVKLGSVQVILQQVWGEGV